MSPVPTLTGQVFNRTLIWHLNKIEQDKTHKAVMCPGKLRQLVPTIRRPELLLFVTFAACWRQTHLSALRLAMGTIGTSDSCSGGQMR